MEFSNAHAHSDLEEYCTQHATGALSPSKWTWAMQLEIITALWDKVVVT